jgi:hypothetical protein
MLDQHQLQVIISIRACCSDQRRNCDNRRLLRRTRANHIPEIAQIQSALQVPLQHHHCPRLLESLPQPIPRRPGRIPAYLPRGSASEASIILAASGYKGTRQQDKQCECALQGQSAVHMLGRRHPQSLQPIFSYASLYSDAIIRTIHHPNRLPLQFAHVSTNPLYSVVFYSKENSTVYVYSINGQFLDCIQDKSGFIYNLSVLKSTDSTECLVYLNAQRELFVWELPFLQLRRKVKVKRDEYRISCFEACLNSKIAICGTEDGALQIIANPAAY